MPSTMLLWPPDNQYHVPRLSSLQNPGINNLVLMNHHLGYFVIMTEKNNENLIPTFFSLT